MVKITRPIKPMDKSTKKAKSKALLYISKRSRRSKKSS